MKSYIYFWEDGRWSKIDKLLFITNSSDTDIYNFAAQLPYPALLLILCGTFETFLEGNSSTFNLLAKTFFRVEI